MRVLHLISSGGMYGAEAVILNLSRAQTAAGDAPLVGVFANGSQQLYQRARSEALPAVLVPCSGPVSPRTVPALQELVRQHGIDVVHTHGYKADLYAWAALRGGQTQIVSTCHGWIASDRTVRAYGVLDRRALRSFPRVVAVSDAVEQRLLRSGVAAERVRRIRNGIDLAPFADGRERTGGKAVCFGFVGRLSREKGILPFVEAAAVVAAARPGVSFVVVGEGPERPAVEARIAALGLGERMTLAGHREVMPPVYAGFDVLVCASLQEGLPMALLEGMASGLPVVSTTVGEVPTFVLPGRTGLLVTPGDPAELADAMLRMASDDEARLAMGCNARQIVEKDFSAARMAAEYRAVYDEARALVQVRA